MMRLKDELNKKMREYIAESSAALDEARDYLSMYADNWNNEHEQNYLDHINRAKFLFIRATTIEEVLKTMHT